MSQLTIAAAAGVGAGAGAGVAVGAGAGVAVGAGEGVTSGAGSSTQPTITTIATIATITAPTNFLSIFFPRICAKSDSVILEISFPSK